MVVFVKKKLVSLTTNENGAMLSWLAGWPPPRQALCRCVNAEGGYAF